MARLHRPHRVIWVNPPASPEYAARADGCRSRVDEFVAGHSLAAPEDLVEVIA
jgi:uncharacterized protein with von Willebrand factor type A (vWA) domain